MTARVAPANTQQLSRTDYEIYDQTETNVKGEQNKEQTSMENGRITKFCYQRFITIDTAVARVHIINIFLLIVYFEFDYVNEFNPLLKSQYTKLVQLILWLLALCTSVEVPMAVFREFAKLDLDFYQRKIYRKKLSKGCILHLTFQIAIILVQPTVLTNDYTVQMYDALTQDMYNFKVNYLITLLSLLRLFFVCRSDLINTVYMNPRSHRISKMYLCKADYLYALKCIFKDYPNKFIATYFIMSIAIFSFGMRVCERPMSAVLASASVPQFQYLISTIWYTIITMSTVGYGDLYPRSYIGRVICILLVLWGIVIVSIMVVVLNNTFQMQSKQLKVLSLVKKLELREQLRVVATNMIISIYRTKKQKKQQKEMIEKHQRKYKKLKNEFKDLKKQIKGLQEDSDVYGVMSRSFNILEEDLYLINRNQVRLINYIHDNIQSSDYMTNQSMC